MNEAIFIHREDSKTLDHAEHGGQRLADLVRAEYPESKILFLSGYSDQAILPHGKPDPAVSFLEKPFSLETLAGRVRAILDS